MMYPWRSEVKAMSLCVQRMGIKCRAYYDSEKEIGVEIRKFGKDYELWVISHISECNEKYLENYAQVDLTREQLIKLRDLINEKLNSE